MTDSRAGLDLWVQMLLCEEIVGRDTLSEAKNLVRRWHSHRHGDVAFWQFPPVFKLSFFAGGFLYLGASDLLPEAQFGYTLLWVIVASNLMAMLIQTLSAKLGIATGLNLAEQCRTHFPRPVVLFMWVWMPFGRAVSRRKSPAGRTCRCYWCLCVSQQQANLVSYSRRIWLKTSFS